MKKISTILTSVMLCVTMLTALPAQVVASAAGNAKKYVSEVKVGMGVTADEAAKELLAEGYTILADGKGYADLNKDAGTDSLLKEGPKEKIVLLGYKTTEKASEAITDLAVMNMNGGYSFQDYEKLMQQQMDTQIKPFVDRFVSTLEEYRQNLQKPQDSVNYKRANYYRTLLNKLTDDDTGNKPLGDLLVNKTKYELGDDAYNKLSDEEKKNHCDILTLLMQGNGQAVQLMETELTKSADPGSNTWLDRFVKTDLEKLTENVKQENPGMTPSELNAELDKQYNDDAKKILEKWSAFGEILDGYDDALEKADEVIKAGDSREDIKLSKKPTDEEVKKAVAEAYTTEATMVKGGMAAEDIIVHDYLQTTEYGDGTLLEFFERPQSDFTGEDGIRELYPIVEALTGGQLAGLDFLSVKDMIVMAITDEKGFQSVNVDTIKPASIYQDVNREIYEKGNVALTNDALRAKANAQDTKASFELSDMGLVYWCCTIVSGLALAGSVYSLVNLEKTAPLLQLDALKQQLGDAQAHLAHVANDIPVNDDNYGKLFDEAYDKYNAIDKQIDDFKATDEFKSAYRQYSLKSGLCKFLTAGFSVAMALLAGYSIYTTITEMMAYYKVDFVPIPKYIVEETDITATNKKDETVMIQNQTAYYKVVLCNRTDGAGSNVEKKNHEILQDRSDLNGDVGKQWLALYSVKYKNGMPILADSLMVQTGKTDLPEGYTTGIHRFGEKAAFNLTSEYYCYTDAPKGTYVFFKHDDASVKDLTATGSSFSGGFIALGAVLGVIAGTGVTLLIVKLAGKKKKNTAA